VWLWRLERGLTQDALARLARVSRPNLSAIERGHREVSLSTLRALAAALGIRPGVLADGVAPPSTQIAPRRLSRETLERIAAAVVSGSAVADSTTRPLVEALRAIVGQRVAVAGQAAGSLRRGTRKTERAWALVHAALPPAALQNLLQRIDDQLRRR